VQRQRQQQQQQQLQQASTPENQGIIDYFAILTWDLLEQLIKALVVTSRGCLPPEVLQQAGLQLLQALAAPLQQWQLSRSSDAFLHDAAVAVMLPRFGNTLQQLVTAACGAQDTRGQLLIGEQKIRGSAVFACHKCCAFTSSCASYLAPQPL
jgi:hypothetical protein